MNAKIKCKIGDIRKDNEFVSLTLSSVDGRVDTKILPAQDILFSGTLFIKPVIADQIKIGSIINIEVSVEDPQLL